MADSTIGGLGSQAFALTDLLPHEPLAGPPARKGDINALITLLNTVYGTGPFVPLAGGTMTGLLQFSGTGHFGLRLNNLTTAQRDAIGVGSAGNAIWNTTTSRFDFNIGAAWRSFVRLDGDTMTGLLTIAQATANTSALASTGYSLTGANSQSLLSLAGTWNTSGTPTAIKLDILDTASNAASNLIDLQTNSVSRFSIDRLGKLRLGGWGATSYLEGTGTSTLDVTIGGVNVFRLNGSQLGIINMLGIGANGSSPDIVLTREAAAQLALRNTTNAQTFRWYRTWTDASNYERGALQTAAGQVIIAAETAGTGTDNIDVVLTAAGTGLVNASLGIFRLGTAKTVATLPAAGTQGRIAYVTDSLAPAFLTTVVGGGAVITTVFDNGTNWVAV